MKQDHLVRVGILGRIGRFSATEPVCYPRRSQVVCRTPRGLEVGQVLRPVPSSPAAHRDGQLLRRMTVEDRLLVERIERRKEEALEACRQALAERRIGAVLVDVELLLDGRSLYFYFLGPSTPELDEVTRELAEVYESKVQFRRFTETLLAGCGPECGSEEAGGCGGGCSQCAVAEACGATRRTGSA